MEDVIVLKKDFSEAEVRNAINDLRKEKGPPRCFLPALLRHYQGVYDGFLHRLPCERHIIYTSVFYEWGAYPLGSFFFEKA